MTGAPCPDGNGGTAAGPPPFCASPHASAESPVGALCRALPSFARMPPVEAVVFAWGAAEDHQLGLDATPNTSTPKVLEALLGLQLMGRAFPGTPLIGGSRNTLAIDAEGQLLSWGWNDRGTLGHGHREKEKKPRRVQGLKGVRIMQAAIGGWHCLALSESGQVYAWGGNEYSQCGLQDPSRDILTPQPCMPQLRVRQVACGGMNSLVLTEEGVVWTWGEPWGDFSLEVSREPRKVEGASNIAAIACGAFHSMALSADGEVLAWGTNDYGQLGNGSTCYSTVPEKVVDLDGTPIADIAAGGWHSMALSCGGEVFVWGRGEYGRLGVGDRTGSSKLRPHPVKGLEVHAVVQVAAGGTHSMALTSSGRIFIWGRASYGRLGLGEGAKDCYSPVELALPGGHERWKVAAVTCGGRHSMCLAIPVRDTQGGAEGGGGGGAAATAGSPAHAGSRAGAVQQQWEDGSANGGAATARAPALPPPAQQQQVAAAMLRAGSGSPTRRPASAGGSGSGAAAAAVALAPLPLSREGSRGMPSARSAATPAQVRVLSPGRPAHAAAAAAASPRAAPGSPGVRGGRLVAGPSGAVSEEPAEDATPISGDEGDESEAEARAQARVDRRHGTGGASGAGLDGFAAGGEEGGGGGGPRPGGEGAGDEGGGGAEAGHVFGRTESVLSVAESVESLGSPVAPGPAGAYNVSVERTSIHNLTHLS